MGEHIDLRSKRKPVPAESRLQGSAIADLQWEMDNIPGDLRREAAGELLAKVLAQTPLQYQDPWLRNAVKASIETTLGLRELPSEEGES